MCPTRAIGAGRFLSGPTSSDRTRDPSDCIKGVCTAGGKWGVAFRKELCIVKLPREPVWRFEMICNGDGSRRRLGLTRRCFSMRHGTTLFTAVLLLSLGGIHVAQGNR